MGRLHLNYSFSSFYPIIGEKVLELGKIQAEIKTKQKNNKTQ